MCLYRLSQAFWDVITANSGEANRATEKDRNTETNAANKQHRMATTMVAHMQIKETRACSLLEWVRLYLKPLTIRVNPLRAQLFYQLNREINSSVKGCYLKWLLKQIECSLWLHSNSYPVVLRCPLSNNGTNSFHRKKNPTSSFTDFSKHIEFIWTLSKQLLWGGKDDSDTERRVYDGVNIVSLHLSV